MELKDIASVSGKGGLFKVVKPTRNGVILETIDELKNKVIATANNRVSLLKEISIYTTDKEGSVPLEDVFTSIYKKYGKNIGIDAKSASTPQLQDLLGTVLPNYDKDRVYSSDMKKLVLWYQTLSQYSPEIFEEGQEATEENVENKEVKKKPVAAKEKTSEKTTKSTPKKESAKEGLINKGKKS